MELPKSILFVFLSVSLMVIGESNDHSEHGGCDTMALESRCMDILCLDYIKEICTLTEYKQEYCACCKYCPYPFPHHFNLSADSQVAATSNCECANAPKTSGAANIKPPILLLFGVISVRAIFLVASFANVAVYHA